MTSIYIGDKPFTTLEQFLGRRLDESARGSVATLNDLDAEMEREVRELAIRSRLAALSYLEYHVRMAGHYAYDFIDEALLSRKEPVQTWGRSDVLCHPEFKLEDLLTSSIHDLLEPVRLQEGSKWYRVVPTRRDWHWSGMGAPGSLVRNAPYWWEPTSDLCDACFLDRELDSLEPITDLDVATRRWIASRVAWRLHDDLASIRGSDDVCQRLQIDQASLGEDAALAIRGLVCSLPVDDADVPGFTGPDSAFTKQA